MKRRDEITREELEAQGWEFDHHATYRGYMPAGFVSLMSDRKGFEWCRIHVGRSCGKNKEYQETVVMRRAK